MYESVYWHRENDLEMFQSENGAAQNVIVLLLFPLNHIGVWSLRKFSFIMVWIKISSKLYHGCEIVNCTCFCLLVWMCVVCFISLRVCVGYFFFFHYYYYCRSAFLWFGVRLTCFVIESQIFADAIVIAITCVAGLRVHFFFVYVAIISIFNPTNLLLIKQKRRIYR